MIQIDIPEVVANDSTTFTIGVTGLAEQPHKYTHTVQDPYKRNIACTHLSTHAEHSEYILQLCSG